jgi:hypothetical protein
MNKSGMDIHKTRLQVCLLYLMFSDLHNTGDLTSAASEWQGDEMCLSWLVS